MKRGGTLLLGITLVCGATRVGPLLTLVLVGGARCLDPVTSGGAGKDGGSDGGAVGACGDAGGCTEDAQCATGEYCDFKLASCPSGVGSAIVDGKCLPIVTERPAECSVGEDCPPHYMCLNSYYQPCTTTDPCDGGYCGFAPGPRDGNCVPGCHHVDVPHYWDFPCICAGANCCVTECPGDRYALCATLDRCHVPFDACQSSLAAACVPDQGDHPEVALVACLGTCSCDVNGCVADGGLGLSGFLPECFDAVVALDRTYINPDAGLHACGPAGWTCLVDVMCCSRVCVFPDSSDHGVCAPPDAGCIP